MLRQRGYLLVLRPAMARAVLDLKIESFASATPDARGRRHRKSRVPHADRCRRRAPRGLPIRVVHPVELLDESYRVGGIYRPPINAGSAPSARADAPAAPAGAATGP